MCKPKAAPLTCPSGTTQVGDLNADVSRCGYNGNEGCADRYDIHTIEDCRDKCRADAKCASFTWAPVGGDKLHMEKTVCSLYAVNEPDQQWGPNQVMCKPDPVSLACPSGSTQVGELNADVSRCGLEDCEVRYDVSSIESCQANCEKHRFCKSFTWAPLRGDKLHMNKTVCSLYAVDQQDQQW